MNLGGKPVLAWTIEHAESCRYIDDVVVSTDNKKIADIARNWGGNVPFMRPRELAEDSSKIIDVINHALLFLENSGHRFDILVLLQPTCPLRAKKDVECAVELFFEKNAKAVISVSEVEHSPLWSNTLPADGSMRRFLKPEVINRNRQELPTYYRLNGSIYIASIEHLKRNQSFFGEHTFAYIMPRERSIDIDTIIDFLHVKAIMEYDNQPVLPDA